MPARASERQRVRKDLAARDQAGKARTTSASDGSTRLRQRAGARRRAAMPRARSASGTRRDQRRGPRPGARRHGGRPAARAASTSSLTLRQMWSFRATNAGSASNSSPSATSKSRVMTSLIRPGSCRHHDDARAERDRFLDIVRDEEHGLRVAPPDPAQLVLQDAPRLRIERAERLVHQQHLGLAGERLGDRDALLHAARELARIAVVRSPRGGPARCARRRSARARPRARPAPRARSAMLPATVSQGKSE